MPVSAYKCETADIDMARTEVDPILNKLRSILDAMYGDRIERVVLFGSRARGEAHTTSDYDVAIFLAALSDRWAELDRLADLNVAFLDETGALVDIKPYPAGFYAERTPLMREIRREGRDF